MWRHRRSDRFQGGGGQANFIKMKPNHDGLVLPMVVNGMDLGAFFSAMHLHISKAMREAKAIGALPNIDYDAAMNSVLPQVPVKPDDRLR